MLNKYKVNDTPTGIVILSYFVGVASSTIPEINDIKYKTVKLILFIVIKRII